MKENKFINNKQRMQRQPRNQYILYYSAFDKNSNRFRSELSRSRHKSQFVLKCVDPPAMTNQRTAGVPRPRPPLPVWLKKVPTIYIVENGVEKKYIGADAFSWLQGNTDKSGNVVKPQSGPPKMIDSTNMETFNGEMTGFSPGYSLLDGTATDQGFSLLGQDQRIDTPTDSGQAINKTTTTTYNANIPVGNPGNVPNGTMQNSKDGRNGDILNDFDRMMQERAAERDALEKGPRPI